MCGCNLKERNSGTGEAGKGVCARIGGEMVKPKRGLEALYDDEVTYFGKKSTRDEVIKEKRVCPKVSGA
jgi:hypothetical protein